jgi:hypothetical protein
LSFETDVERAIRPLNEANVAVYPVDARGVMAMASFEADRATSGTRNRPAWPRSALPLRRRLAMPS